MVGLGSGAENHTVLVILGISIHFKSNIFYCVSPLVTFSKQKVIFIPQIPEKVP